MHALVHFHLIASGCLFAWVIAGPDPAPNRPTVRARLFTMAAAIAIHSTVSQLIFAGLFTQVHAPRRVLRAAGNLMYFGGDIAELLLALALLTTWRPSRSRPLLERPAGRVS